MKIYIIRHGETDWNIARRMQGQTNIPLNENGRNQAQATSKALSDITFDAIYASPLDRAYETASIIKGNRNIDIITDNRLKEINLGVWEGESIPKLKEEKNENMDYFLNNPSKYQPVEDSETFEEIYDRATDFIKEMYDRHKDDTILIVSHSILIKSLLRYIKDISLEDFWSGNRLYHCSVTITEVDDGKMNIIQEAVCY